MDRRSKARGFTLAEILIATVVFSLFLVPMHESFIIGLRAVHSSDDREQIRQQLVAALDRLTRDISLANNVDAAQDDRFQFDTPSVNNVDYRYASGALTRGDASTSARTILSNITSFDLNYFDTTGTELSTPVAGAQEDTIRVVQIIITVTKDTEAITIASAAFLRNI